MLLKILTHDELELTTIQYHLDNGISNRKRVLITSIANQYNHVVATKVRTNERGVNYLVVKARNETVMKNKTLKVISELNKVLL